MSFAIPSFIIPRRPVFQPAGEAGVWEKMSPMLPDATASPRTPEFLDLNNLPFEVRANPVPEILFAAGLANQPSAPHTLDRDLMHGLQLPAWDGTLLNFFLFEDNQLRAPFNRPVYPGPTTRVPRGAVFHAKVLSHGPPPHTIHWHGIEPTSINDGVGHCSMEIGNYTYQWQPNFIGTLFLPLPPEYDATLRVRPLRAAPHPSPGRVFCLHCKGSTLTAPSCSITSPSAPAGTDYSGAPRPTW